LTTAQKYSDAFAAGANHRLTFQAMVRYCKVPLASFSGEQLDQVMIAARSLPIERRDAFLRLIAEQLKVKDIDVVDAVERALRYVNQAA
jgi:hypothetical protein